MRTSLGEHTELVTTDRLLELVEQFAAAEGRMKWAPNKKLHFEVAIIRAIQSLGQATLDEVIENLSALRDGKPVAGGVDAGSAGIAEPGYSKSKSESARIAESPSSYKATQI